MPTNALSPSATACSCVSIAHVLRSIATCVEDLHERGRKHDEAYMISLVEMGLGAALHLAVHQPPPGHDRGA